MESYKVNGNIYQSINDIVESDDWGLPIQHIKINSHNVTYESILQGEYAVEMNTEQEIRMCRNNPQAHTFIEKPNGYTQQEYCFLLQTNPEYFDFVDTTKFVTWDVSHILEVQPQLINRFTKDNLESLLGIHIEHLLKLQPQLSEYFDLNKMSDKEKDNLLRASKPQPKGIEWDKRSSKEQVKMIAKKWDSLSTLDKLKTICKYNDTQVDIQYNIELDEALFMIEGSSDNLLDAERVGFDGDNSPATILVDYFIPVLFDGDLKK